MPSPVTSDDFNFGGTTESTCDLLKRLLTIADKLKAFLGWLLDSETGELSDSALAGFSSQIVPIGTLLAYAGRTVPEGFIWPTGQQNLSRTIYAALFAVVGTTYGAGDGSTTFGIFDTRNLFMRGVNVASEAGTTAGTDNVTLAQANLPADPALPGGPNNRMVQCDTGGNNKGLCLDKSSSEPTESYDWTQNLGSGLPFSIVPTHMKVIWILKY